MTGLSKYVQATWLTSPNHDLASVCVLEIGKFDIASSIDLVEVTLEAPEHHYVRAELEFVPVFLHNGAGN